MIGLSESISVIINNTYVRVENAPFLASILSLQLKLIISVSEIRIFPPFLEPLKKKG